MIRTRCEVVIDAKDQQYSIFVRRVLASEDVRLVATAPPDHYRGPFRVGEFRLLDIGFEYPVPGRTGETFISVHPPEIRVQDSEEEVSSE